MHTWKFLQSKNVVVQAPVLLGLGHKTKQYAAAAAVSIQDKWTHVVVGEVWNHDEVTTEDLLENSNVESEYKFKGASDSEEDVDEKENELRLETDTDFIQWQWDTFPRQPTQEFLGSPGPWDWSSLIILLIYSHVLLCPICKLHNDKAEMVGEEQEGHVRKWCKTCGAEVKV